MQTPNPMLSEEYTVPLHQFPRPRLKMSDRLYLLSLDLDHSLCLDPLDSHQSIVKQERTKTRKRRTKKDVDVVVSERNHDNERSSLAVPGKKAKNKKRIKKSEHRSSVVIIPDCENPFVLDEKDQFDDSYSTERTFLLNDCYLSDHCYFSDVDESMKQMKKQKKVMKRKRRKGKKPKPEGKTEPSSKNFRTNKMAQSSCSQSARELRFKSQSRMVGEGDHVHPVRQKGKSGRSNGIDGICVPLRWKGVSVRKPERKIWESDGQESKQLYKYNDWKGLSSTIH